MKAEQKHMEKATKDDPKILMGQFRPAKVGTPETHLM